MFGSTFAMPLGVFYRKVTQSSEGAASAEETARSVDVRKARRWEVGKSLFHVLLDIQMKGTMIYWILLHWVAQKKMQICAPD